MRKFTTYILIAAVASLAFVAVVFLTTLIIVDGAALGGEIAGRSGDIARLYGPNLAEGVGVIVLPLVVGAALNRFANMRFVLSASVLALLLAAVFAVLSVVRDAGWFFRLLPVAALIGVLTVILLAASAALADAAAKDLLNISSRPFCT